MHVLPLATAIALLSVASKAQERPTAAVTALLDKIDRTLGLPSEEPRSLEIEGTYAVAFERNGGGEPVAKGAFREHFVGHELGRHRSEMGEFGALERGFTKDLVWEVDPAMGARVYRGHNARAVRRFYAVIAGRSPRDLYQTFEQTGTERIEGVECSVLRMTPRQGKPDVWYVDGKGRTARIATALPAPESSAAGAGIDDLVPTTVTFADWRKVGQARLPHRRELKMGPATVSFACSRMKTGEIAAETFEPPAAIAAVDQKAAKPAFGPDGEVNYEVVDRKMQPVASIRIKCKPSEVSQQLAVLLPEVMAHLNATGGKVAGAPFSRYHSWGTGELEMEAGIPVKQSIEEKGRIKNSSLPAGRAVACWHVGPYHGLSKAHAGLMGYVRSEKLEQRGGPWEIYWTDPGMVPDPAKWRTQLFVPIK